MSPSLRIDVLSIFPDLIDQFTAVSVVGRGQRHGVIAVRSLDVRAVTTDKHRTVDDAPFGGGAGMVMKPEPIFDTVEQNRVQRPLLYLSPAGRRFDQAYAHELARSGGFSLLCGRYEGVDERVRTHLIDGEVSVGDVVLAGGEAAALVVIEAVARLVPGVLGNLDSSGDESFSNGLLEYPHYTRPADYRGWSVPEVLTSGNHAVVDRWRRAQALWRTIERRPDLIEARGGLTTGDRALLVEFGLGPITL